MKLDRRIIIDWIQPRPPEQQVLLRTKPADAMKPPHKL